MHRTIRLAVLLAACGSEAELHESGPDLTAEPAVLRVDLSDPCGSQTVRLSGLGELVGARWHPALGGLDDVWVPPVRSLPIVGHTDIGVHTCPSGPELAGALVFDLANGGEVSIWIQGVSQ